MCWVHKLGTTVRNTTPMRGRDRKLNEPTYGIHQRTLLTRTFFHGHTGYDSMEYEESINLKIDKGCIRGRKRIAIITMRGERWLNALRYHLGIDSIIPTRRWAPLIRAGTAFHFA